MPRPRRPPPTASPPDLRSLLLSSSQDSGGGGAGPGGRRRWRAEPVGGSGLRELGGQAPDGELDGGWVVVQGKVHCEVL